MRSWKLFQEGVAIYHALGAIVSGVIWAVARLMKLDRAWIVGSVIGLSLFLLALALSLAHSHWSAWRRGAARWRTQRNRRNWTGKGLNWQILPKENLTLPDGRSQATLSIAPVSGSELPQPLDIVVTCGNLIAEISSLFLPEGEPTEDRSSGNVVIDAPDGYEARLKLYSPKLVPPSKWHLLITSTGNGGVSVLSVRRAPE